MKEGRHTALKNEIKIFLNREGMYMNSSNLIKGEIYFKIGDAYFPEKHWTDFVSVILAWWGREVVAAIDNKVNMELQFMDGSYKIRCRKMNDNRYEMDCLDGEAIVIHDIISKKELITKMKELYSNFLFICDEKGLKLENRKLFERNICLLEEEIEKLKRDEK